MCAPIKLEFTSSSEQMLSLRSIARIHYARARHFAIQYSYGLGIDGKFLYRITRQDERVERHRVWCSA